MALTFTAQLSGMTFGLSISGAVFVNMAQNGLYEVLPRVPKDQVDRPVAGTTSGLLTTLSPEVQTAALEVIVSSWQKVFIVVYVGAAISLACAIFFKVRTHITFPLYHKINKAVHKIPFKGQQFSCLHVIAYFISLEKHYVR